MFISYFISLDVFISYSTIIKLIIFTVKLKRPEGHESAPIHRHTTNSVMKSVFLFMFVVLHLDSCHENVVR